MDEIGKTGETEKAYDVGVEIGEYLSELGFNVDFAPVADVLSNPQNKVVSRRSFGEDAEIVSDMSLAVSQGLQSQGIYGTYKAFSRDMGQRKETTHEGYAYTNKTMDKLRIM